MLAKLTPNDYLHTYYKQWIAIYKEGAIRNVTLQKYNMTLHWLQELAPDLKLCDVNRIVYQQLLNNYAKEHERVTTMDFHHQRKLGEVSNRVKGNDGRMDLPTLTISAVA